MDGKIPRESEDWGALWIYVESYNSIGLPAEMGRGLRPVFTLSPNVKIISGEGTEEDPFEIGL